MDEIKVTKERQSTHYWTPDKNLVTHFPKLMQTNNAGIYWVSHLFCRKGLDKPRRFEFLYICLGLDFRGILKCEESQSCVRRIASLKCALV
jgi:hypothetical protein